MKYSMKQIALYIVQKLFVHVHDLKITPSCHIKNVVHFFQKTVSKKKVKLLIYVDHAINQTKTSERISDSAEYNLQF